MAFAYFCKSEQTRTSRAEKLGRWAYINPGLMLPQPQLSFCSLWMSGLVCKPSIACVQHLHGFARQCMLACSNLLDAMPASCLVCVLSQSALSYFRTGDMRLTAGQIQAALSSTSSNTNNIAIDSYQGRSRVHLILFWTDLEITINMKNLSAKNLSKKTQVLFSYENPLTANQERGASPYSGDPTLTTTIIITTSSILHMK